MLNKLILAFIIIAHVFILSKLIYFPYPELFIYPYLTNHGLKPYQQIMDQHFPGLMFLPINFDNLGMRNEVIARWWSVSIVALTQLMLFFIAKKILKDDKKALLVNSLYLIWQPFFEGWVLWIDSFLPLLLLGAFYFLYCRQFLFSGFLIGLGIVFKQTLIPLAFLVLVFTFFQNRKSFFSFLLAILAPLALIILHLFKIGVLKDFWYWTIIFNLTTYAKFGTNFTVHVSFITRILLVYLPFILIWFTKDKRLNLIFTIFLIGSMAGVFDRASFVHFQPSLPFAILATILGLGRMNNVKKIGITLYIMLAVWWLIIFYKGHIGDKVFFFETETKQIAGKIKQYTNPADKIFVFGAPPHLYQMADRLPAGNLFVFQFPWFLKAAEEKILTGLIQDQPKIIIADRNAEIEGKFIKDYAEKIDRYIRENYEKIDSVGSTEILRRENGQKD